MNRKAALAPNARPIPAPVQRMQLPVAEILFDDPRAQVRVAGIDDDYLRELERELPTHALEIDVVRDGAYWLCLSAHRGALVQQRGLSLVTANVYAEPPDGIRQLAYDLNVSHGHNLSTADRRLRAVELLTEHPDWAGLRIAKYVRISGQSIAALRRRLEAQGDIPSLPQRIDVYGKSRPASSPTRLEPRVKAARALLRGVERELGVLEDAAETGEEIFASVVEAIVEAADEVWDADDQAEVLLGFAEYFLEAAARCVNDEDEGDGGFLSGLRERLDGLRERFADVAERFIGGADGSA
jgi:hypothetical protein